MGIVDIRAWPTVLDFRISCVVTKLTRYVNKPGDISAMQFTDERVEDGDVRRYSFNLTVAGDIVPAALWAPNGAKGARPLVLMGHGGSQHKKTPGIVRAPASTQSASATQRLPSTRRIMVIRPPAKRRRRWPAASARGCAARDRR